MDDTIDTTVSSPDIPAEPIKPENTQKYSLGKVGYYILSVLTLGLPHDMELLRNEWDSYQRCQEDEPDVQDLVADVVLAVRGVVVATKIGAICYVYYSALENIIR